MLRGIVNWVACPFLVIWFYRTARDIGRNAPLAWGVAGCGVFLVVSNVVIYGWLWLFGGLPSGQAALISIEGLRPKGGLGGFGLFVGGILSGLLSALAIHSRVLVGRRQV